MIKKRDVEFNAMEMMQVPVHFVLFFFFREKGACEFAPFPQFGKLQQKVNVLM